MIDENLDLIEKGLAGVREGMREEWELLRDGYAAYRAVLAGAGVPMFLDGDGRPTVSETPATRDLIDGLRDLAARHAEAMETLLRYNRAIPAVCPVTGEPFVAVLEHPEDGWVALYGGAEGSHTIPAFGRDAGAGDAARASMRRYDAGSGAWSDEAARDVLVPEQELEQLLENYDDKLAGAASLEKELVDAQAALEAMRAQREILAGTLERLATACRAQADSWRRRPIDPDLVCEAMNAARAAKGEGGTP